MIQVGTVIHGFAGGYFGRDSYACRTVVSAWTELLPAPPYVVTWNGQEYELIQGQAVFEVDRI